MNETGYICMTQRQKNNLRSGDTVVHLVQKNFEHSCQSPSWQHIFSGTKLEYCWSTNSKRVQQSQKATTHLSWVKWRRKWSLNGGGSCHNSVISPGQRLLTHGCHHTAEVGGSALWSAETRCSFTWSGNFNLPCVPKFEKKIMGTNFSTTEDTISAANDWFATQHPGFYLAAVKKLEQQSRKCDDLMGGGVRLIN